MFRLLFLGNGWVDCVEIWYAFGNPLATAYAVVTDGVSLHVRTCTPRFCISQTARPIVFNHPFPFFPLTIVFLVIDIVTSARIASVCIEDVVVRI